MANRAISCLRLAREKGGIKSRFQARIMRKVNKKMVAVNIFTHSLNKPVRLPEFKEEHVQEFELNGEDWRYIRKELMIAYEEYNQDLLVKNGMDIIKSKMGVFSTFSFCLDHLSDSELDALTEDLQAVKTMANDLLRKRKRRRENNKNEPQPSLFDDQPKITVEVKVNGSHQATLTNKK